MCLLLIYRSKNNYSHLSRHTQQQQGFQRQTIDIHLLTPETMTSTMERRFARCALTQLEPKLVGVRKVTAEPGEGRWEITFDPPIPGPASLTFTHPTQPGEAQIERCTSEARRLWRNLVISKLALPEDDIDRTYLLVEE